ncbi:hypothetical protein CLM62_12860 [Streptomyces sp. SA15]|uniref:hypothetical protein n=1 Tax=Streptomyces sp. SA15 TaxID=934019 RepID=UPI000BB05D01|nr:hypothetical protein [Streptomyces sp. SA15]PAZ15681.1 hypothetical protein CLM62_12860 [Streptomyces sp. SA15]
MATSRVPAAVDALLSILRAASALSAVDVVDGPPTTDLSNLKRIHVGWQPGAEAAVGLRQEFAYAGARRRDEEFDIVCYAEARSGDTDMAARRTEVFALVAAVEDALRATDAAPTAPTLNGAVLWAELTTGSLQQVQADGSLAGLAFTVACRARI